MLVPVLTYAMMCLVERVEKIEDYYSDLRPTGDTLRRVEAFRSEVRSELQEDDQLWQWESSGLRHFSGVTGLLVERHGEIIKVWTTGRS
jgi:hypothetical protein